MSSSGHGEHAEHAGHAGHTGHGAVDVDEVDCIAATAQDSLRTPLTITPPDAGQVWTAEENREAYRLVRDAVAVDGSTGEVTDRVDFADWPLMARASDWLIQLHMGTLFGLPNQIVLGLLAAGIIAMVCWGYAMWWKRRPQGSLFASAPPRAGWTAPTVGTVLLVAALVAYGLLAPVFGVTCLISIAGSALWSAVTSPPRGDHDVRS